MANLGGTLVRNAELLRDESVAQQGVEHDGLLERTAWTELLSDKDVKRLRAWVRVNGSEFIRRADRWIGEHRSRHLLLRNYEVRACLEANGNE